MNFIKKPRKYCQTQKSDMHNYQEQIPCKTVDKAQKNPKLF